jgi:hypothetical protein
MPDAELRQPASPPLRIHHFFLLMTCMALVACWRQALTEKLAESPRRSTNTPAAIFRISLTQTIGYGGMLAVTIASLAWKARRRTAPWEPGQWLALAGTVELAHLVIFTLDRFVPWFGPPEDGPRITMPVRREFVYYLACVAIVGIIAMRRNHGRVWQIAFGVLALQMLVYALGNGAFVAAGWSRGTESTFHRVLWISSESARFARTAALIAIAAAALIQLIRRPRDSWAHWCGVAFWLAMGWSFEIARCLSAL